MWSQLARPCSPRREIGGTRWAAQPGSREAAEGEGESEGSTVARKWGNAHGATGPCCTHSEVDGRQERMRRPLISLQDLRRRIYAKAKTEPSWRFWGSRAAGAQLEAPRLRLEEVEYAVAAHAPGSLWGLPDAPWVTAESAPGLIGHIILGAERAGEPCAGNPHARFERAGTGDGLTATTTRARSRKRRIQPSQSLRGTAPVPDPTEGAAVLAERPRRVQAVVRRLIPTQ